MMTIQCVRSANSVHVGSPGKGLRSTLLVVLFLLNGGFSLTGSSHVFAEETPGMVAEKPTEGFSVKTENGWMVPYDVLIPETEVRFRMVPIPAGEYLMGSPDSEAGRASSEGPQRRVSVEPFWMAECEVTWEQYKLFMNLYRSFKEFQSLNQRVVTDTNRIDAITAPTPLYEPDFTFEYGEEPQQAAVSITQYSAKQYTKWISGITGHQFRLPTEAEWEYACRAETTTAWFFGDDPALLKEYANYAYDGSPHGALAVRQKKPNPWGLYDIHGNAAEWVLDGFAPYKPSDKPLNAAADWVRSDKPYPRVVRGGSWEFSAAECRSAARLGSNDLSWKEYDPNRPRSPWWFTTDPARGVGFRLIRPLKTVDREAMEEFWKIDCEDTQYDVEDRLNEGRGVLGLVDKELPAAIKALSK